MLHVGHESVVPLCLRSTSGRTLIHLNILTTSHLIYSEAASITTAYEARFGRVEAQSHTPTHAYHTQTLFVCSPFSCSIPLSPSLCHGSENMSQSALQATHVQHVPACWCDFTAPTLYSRCMCVCEHPALITQTVWRSIGRCVAVPALTLCESISNGATSYVTLNTGGNEMYDPILWDLDDEQWGKKKDVEGEMI